MILGWGLAERHHPAWGLNLQVRATPHTALAFLRQGVVAGSLLWFGLSLCSLGVAQSSPVGSNARSLSAVGGLGEEKQSSLLTPVSRIRSAKPYLGRVRQIRQLSSADAKRLIPVKLTGAVRDLSGYKNFVFLPRQDRRHLC